MAAKNQYLNNKKLYQCIREYADRRREAEAEGRERPLMPEYAGECVLMLCKRMGTRYNFAGYSYVQDMVDDAILDCVAAFYNFDPYRFNNPFGYFSRVAWRAMVRRIYTEKRESYLKHKSLMNAYVSGEMWDSPDDYRDPGGERVGADSHESGQSVSEKVVQDFEELLERRKKPKQERVDESR